MSQKMTKSEYARHRGCHPSYIHRVEKKGMLRGATRMSNGRLYIDPEKADILLEKNLSPINRKKTTKAEKIKTVADKKGKATSSEPIDERTKRLIKKYNYDPDIDHNTAKTLSEQKKAELADIDVQIKKRLLIPIEEVESREFNNARITRDAIFNIPERVSARLASETDINTINDILTVEFRQALEALSDG